MNNINNNLNNNFIYNIYLKNVLLFYSHYKIYSDFIWENIFDIKEDFEYITNFIEDNEENFKIIEENSEDMYWILEWVIVLLKDLWYKFKFDIDFNLIYNNITNKNILLGQKEKIINSTIKNLIIKKEWFCDNLSYFYNTILLLRFWITSYIHIEKHIDWKNSQWHITSLVINNDENDWILVDITKYI